MFIRKHRIKTIIGNTSCESCAYLKIIHPFKLTNSNEVALREGVAIICIPFYLNKSQSSLRLEVPFI